MMISKVPLGLLFTLAAALATDLDAEAQVEIRQPSTQSTYFSDQEIALELKLTAERAVDGLVAWKHSSLHRHLASGELAIEVKPAATSEVSIRLRMPHLNPGVALKTTLSASFTETGADKASSTFEQQLWVLSPDPFADRRQWLENLQLQLYDPTGETADRLEAAEIPFRLHHSLTRLTNSDAGIVVVAEGLSLSNEPNVAATLLSLAAAGRSVLWFIPDEGEFEFPGPRADHQGAPDRLLLGGPTIIEQLDPRLDAGLWNRNPRQLRVSARRSQPMIEIVDDGIGWSWLQAEFDNPQGQLLLSGFPLAESWDTSPTPRYLLAALLQQLERDQSKHVADH